MTWATVGPQRNPKRWIYRLCLALAVGFSLLGAVELASWKADRARLRALGIAITAPAQDEAERLTRLTDWLFRNVKPRKNWSYHLWRKLDATPIQILEDGGNCEDKSKLLTAILRELDVASSLAMLSRCEGCRLTHTVAIVRTRTGWTIADPAFGMTFPDHQGGFHTIQALRADPSLLQGRLAELRALRGPADVINNYKLATDHHAHLTTVNWNKNALTRLVAASIRAAGAEPWSTPRPLFLDDPKQFFALFGFGGAIAWGLLALLLRARGTSHAMVLRRVGTDAAAHTQS
ncbi:MAG TPA: transglutaminase-like domain-containing protein [Thermoanaerobaculia bacterium]|nr:transglutaminase-like domain-containing protein [Thermoanaerobaculia bacterium]